MNIRIIRAAGLFTTPARLEAGGFAIDARHFIVATGATPALPAIAGLELMRLLTPEDLPVLEDLPKDLIIDRRQLSTGLRWHRPLCASARGVTLLRPGAILPDEDQELVAPVLTRLAREGLVTPSECRDPSLEPQRAACASISASGAPATASRHRASCFRRRRRCRCVEGFGLKTARVAYSTRRDQGRCRRASTSNPPDPRDRRRGRRPRFGDGGADQGEHVAAALFGPQRARRRPSRGFSAPIRKWPLSASRRPTARARSTSRSACSARLSRENPCARTAFGAGWPCQDRDQFAGSYPRRRHSRAASP